MNRLKGMAEAAMIPIVVGIGDEQVEVPLFDLNEFIKWGSIVDDARTESAVKGLTPFERAQVLSFYRVIPSDVQDLRQRVASPSGMRYVVTTCYRRAMVVGRIGHDDKGAETITPVEKPYPFDTPVEKESPNGKVIFWPKINSLIMGNDQVAMVEHAYELVGIPKPPKKPPGTKADPDDPDAGKDQGTGEDPLTKPGTNSSSGRSETGG